MTPRKRLERIIRLKERIRDVKKVALAAAEQERVSAEQQENAAEAQLNNLRGQLLANGEVSAMELAHRADLAEWAKVDHAQSREHLQQQETIRDEKAEELGVAGREVASLETLADRMKRVEKKKIARAEQELSDEAGGRKAL